MNKKKPSNQYQYEAKRRTNKKNWFAFEWAEMLQQQQQQNENGKKKRLAEWQQVFLYVSRATKFRQFRRIVPGGDKDVISL